MNKIEEIKKKIRDLKLKQKMTTGRLEWNDIQREIDILNHYCPKKFSHRVN